MSIFSKILPLRYSIIIFASLIIVILSLLALFLFDVLVGPKWSAVIPGLLTGFVIALFQALLSWYEIKKVNELKELKVRKILPSREDPVYYGNLISRSKKEIKLLGVTAQRFLDDFGSDSPNAPEHRKVLIKTLNDNDHINIKLLLADYDSIKSNEDNRNKYNLAQKD
ncbi:hypothetical protein ACQE3E_13215 [Methylomonas sp. MED-D]|uniref:hypothetical protein n=1 Tax=Methylomonas sp. MED-D TaxID=3418768 RepID=UPI003D08131C